MNRATTSRLLGGWMVLLFLSGCNEKEKVMPAIIGTWEETEQVITFYDAQNQAQSPQILTTTQGQLLTLRSEGVFEYVRLTGTINGTYTYSGETLTTTSVGSNGFTSITSLKVVEASATKLRLQEGFITGATRSVVEIRYSRK